MQKINPGEELQVLSDECIICFEDGFFLKSKAIGTLDYIFTGQLVPVFDRFDFSYKDLHFYKNEIFIFSNIFSNVNIFIENAKDGQVIVVPDKKLDIDQSLLQKAIKEKNFLIIYDISFEEICSFLERKNIYCGIYYSNKNQVFNVDFIYKKISFLQKIDDLNLSNRNIAQYVKKYKRYTINLLRRKAIIIDLGIGSDKIKDLFCKKYDVFIVNIHTDLEVINDLKPNVIIFSDSFCNPNLAYKTIDDLVNFCINSDIEIYGFGYGMFIISVSIGIKCKLVGFNYKDNYISNYRDQIIRNRFFSYYCLENIESKKILSKIMSFDKQNLYGYIYKYNRKRIIGVNNIENLRYLL